MHNFFAGKRVLVTGATGLVGGHLAELLVQSNAKLFSLSRDLDKTSYFVKQGLQKKSKVIRADILDYAGIQEVLKKNKIEYIFHLAAQLKVVTLYQTFGFNIMGVNNILEAARNCPSVKGIVVTSSNRAYVEGGLNAREMRQLAQSPYDISKTAADLIAQSFQNAYKLPIVICRFGNAYGPGDLHNRVVSLILKNILSGKILKIRASHNKRSYIYAGDVARGLLLAAEHIKALKGRSVNFDAKDNYSVSGLIKKIGEIVGKECKFKIVGKMSEDIALKKSKVNSWQKVLKWKPEVSFKNGIQQTFNWYKA